MKRKFTRTLLLGLSVALIAITISSCKAKVNDADVKTAIETVLKGDPDMQSVTVDVKDGVATLGGQVKDDASKTAAEAGLKEVKGVKSMVNNIQVVAPPAPVVEAPVITPDDPLSKNLVDAVKDNPGVKAEVKDGVVTLTGEIKKSDLPKLMQKINALHPKKTENKLTIK